MKKSIVINSLFLSLLISNSLYSSDIIYELDTDFECVLKSSACFEKYERKNFVDDKAYFVFIEKLRTKAIEEKMNFSDYNHLILKMANQLSYIDRNEAYPYLYELSLNSEELKRLNVSFLPEVYQALGGSDFYFRHYIAAKRNFKLAISHSSINPNSKIDCLNSLGLIARIYNEKEKACSYFEEALKLAYQINHSSWIGVVSGNLGTCKMKIGEYEEAKKLLKSDFDLSRKQGDFMSAYLAYIGLGDIALIENNIPLADKIAAEIEKEQVVNQDLNVEDFTASFLEFKSRLHNKKGEYNKAYECLMKATSIRRNQDLSRENLDLAKMEFQINFENQLRQKEVLAEKQKVKELTYLFTLSIVAIVFIFVTIYFVKNLKVKKVENQKLVKEKEIKEQELQDAQLYIVNVKEHIIKKNKVIDQLQLQMEELKDSNVSLEIQEKSVEHLEELKSSVVLTEDDWIYFKRTFEKLYPTFITNLLQKSPTITNAEIRLATLIKLGLSTTEISNTLGISADSVRKTNLRLRNKLNFKKQEELTELLLTLI
jgi:tetratricopeptide (TPR) repeat protein